MASSTRPKRRKRKRAVTKGDDDDDLDDAAINAELRSFGFLVDDDQEEDLGRWGYDLKEKLTCERFDEHSDQLLERLEGKDFNAHYFRERGFTKPICFEKPDDLGLVVPSGNFSVEDVKKLVGGNRVIDVVDVKTQKGSQMTLREFVDYFQRSDRTRLLNVLSLEFSKTKLSDYVKAPAAVSELDWVELAWPSELRAQQTEATNALNAMKYPKVQKYCLMSVGGCYTDFHVDFGGTSVWYHILQGEKVFWLVPPTDENCQHFQAWTLSGRQHKTFFADLVEHCVRVKLKAGTTFMIPSGWFHAVYTPVDSLVFGGNFLHSFAIPMQLSVYEIEKNTHVPIKFRYPFFLEMHWYVLERYYAELTSSTFLKRDVDMGDQSETDVVTDTDDEYHILKEKAALLTNAELEGLLTLVNWLESLPNSKRGIPMLIRRPSKLLRNLRRLLIELESIQRKPSTSCYTVLSQNHSQSNLDISTSSNCQGQKGVSDSQQDEKKMKSLQPCPAEMKHDSNAAITASKTQSTSVVTSTAKPMASLFLNPKTEELAIPQSATNSSTKLNEQFGVYGCETERFLVVPQEFVPVVGAECTIESNKETN